MSRNTPATHSPRPTMRSETRPAGRGDAGRSRTDSPGRSSGSTAADVEPAGSRRPAPRAAAERSCAEPSPRHEEGGSACPPWVRATPYSATGGLLAGSTRAHAASRHPSRLPSPSTIAATESLEHPLAAEERALPGFVADSRHACGAPGRRRGDRGRRRVRRRRRPGRGRARPRRRPRRGCLGRPGDDGSRQPSSRGRRSSSPRGRAQHADVRGGEQPGDVVDVADKAHAVVYAEVAGGRPRAARACPRAGRRARASAGSRVRSPARATPPCREQRGVVLPRVEVGDGGDDDVAVGCPEASPPLPRAGASRRELDAIRDDADRSRGAPRSARKSAPCSEFETRTGVAAIARRTNTSSRVNGSVSRWFQTHVRAPTCRQRRPQTAFGTSQYGSRTSGRVRRSRVAARTSLATVRGLLPLHLPLRACHGIPASRNPLRPGRRRRSAPALRRSHLLPPAGAARARAPAARRRRDPAT